jgi:hypothetical protein
MATGDQVFAPGDQFGKLLAEARNSHPWLLFSKSATRAPERNSLLQMVKYLQSF